MAKTIANVLVGVAKLEFKYPVGGSYVEFGYTKDGVTIEYSASMKDIDVQETTIPVSRVIEKETIKITANLAESSLINLNQAMAGAVLAGSVITIGGGITKQLSIKITGTNPAGFARTIEIPLATAAGNVGMHYKKGEETIVPITFEALYTAAGSVTITDSTS